jgi:hypothetical protein
MAGRRRFNGLQRAYDERAMRLEQVTGPSFDLLRSDVRFRGLVQRISYPFASVVIDVPKPCEVVPWNSCCLPA